MDTKMHRKDKRKGRKWSAEYQGDERMKKKSEAQRNFTTRRSGRTGHSGVLLGAFPGIYGSYLGYLLTKGFLGVASRGSDTPGE